MKQHSECAGITIYVFVFWPIRSILVRVESVDHDVRNGVFSALMANEMIVIFQIRAAKCCNNDF